MDSLEAIGQDKLGWLQRPRPSTIPRMRISWLVCLACALAACDRGSQNRVGMLVGTREASLARGTLFIASEKLSDSELSAILADPRVSALTELTLHHNALSAAAVRTIAASQKLTALAILDLSFNPLGDEGVTVLASSPVLASLRNLSLAHAGITGEGLHALAHSPHAARIASLDLRFQNIGAAAALLATVPRDKLLLQQTGIDGPTAIILLRTARVKTLELEGNPIRTLAGLDAISASLVSIDLSRCQLADISILTQALAPSLQALELDYNPLGDAGLDALVGAQWLKQIRFLSVMGAKSSPEARQKLRAAWGDRPGLTIDAN